VMAALAISILSDSSKESVVVYAEVPIAPIDLIVAPKVGEVFVISPTRMLDLVDYSSSSDSDPSEDSLPVAPELPLVSPFLCSNESEVDSSSLDSLSDSTSVHSSESSLDSSSERSLDLSSPYTGRSHKRCRSLTIVVPLSTPVSRLIASALTNLPPHKRFKDSYSSEVSGEEHMEMGTDAETVVDLGISEGVGAHTKDGIDLDVEVATSDITEDKEKFEVEASAGGTMEIAVDPLATGYISEPT
nr:hypothetical protein [Tanacetum cinerariifolium]